MKKSIIILFLGLISVYSFSWDAPVYMVKGVIKKIEKDKVTIVTKKNKKVVIEKKYIPQTDLKLGNSIKVIVNSSEAR